MIDNSHLDYEQKQIAQTALKNYVAFAGVLKKFKSPILFSEINSDLWHKLRKYLAVNQKDQNTILRYFTQFQRFINNSINDNLLQSNPFKSILVKPGKQKDLVYITIEQMELLENYLQKSDNPDVQITIASFLFACYTGLRFSDIINLSPENIVNGWIFIIVDLRENRTV